MRLFRGGLLVAITLMVLAMGAGNSVAAGESSRIRVFPLLFLTRDAALTDDQTEAAWEKLLRSLTHTQAHFKKLLGTDTFEIEPNPVPIYRSPNPDSHFMTPEGTSPDSAHLMLRELWAHFGETRENTRRVYLLIYTRHPREECGMGPPPRPCFAGGRSVDAYPVPGGGIVQLEYQSLMENRHYHFLSTLTHEVGHSFGLTHVECLGYDQIRNGSIMSYNPDLYYTHSQVGEYHGNLNPEEYFLLSLHRQAFPQFRYDPALHNPGGTLRPNILYCVTNPMDATLGYPKDKGYRLYFDGKLVSGEAAAIYSFHAAEENCRWNIANHPGTAVTCTYSGKSLDHWRGRIPRR